MEPLQGRRHKEHSAHTGSWETGKRASVCVWCMLCPELENPGGKQDREASAESLHLLMAAQAMKKRAQAGGQGSFLISSSLSLPSGQENVPPSRSGRAIIGRQRASREACWTVRQGVTEESEELPCPRPVVSMVVQDVRDHPCQGHTKVIHL